MTKLEKIGADLKRARVGVVRELRVLARRHEPCSRHRDDGEREQDGEGGGEAEKGTVGVYPEQADEPENYSKEDMENEY